MSSSKGHREGFKRLRHVIAHLFMSCDGGCDALIALCTPHIFLLKEKTNGKVQKCEKQGRR